VVKRLACLDRAVADLVQYPNDLLIILAKLPLQGFRLVIPSLGEKEILGIHPLRPALPDQLSGNFIPIKPGVLDLLPGDIAAFKNNRCFFHDIKRCGPGNTHLGQIMPQMRVLKAEPLFSRLMINSLHDKGEQVIGFRLQAERPRLCRR